VICLVNFLLGLSEIIIGSVRYSSFDGACHDIRDYSIVAGVFNFVSSIILACLIKVLAFEERERYIIFIPLQIFQILPAIANIWSANIYFNITDHCKIFINTNMPEIYQYIILFQFSLMWLSIIFIIFFLIGYCFIWLVRQFCRQAGQ